MSVRTVASIAVACLLGMASGAVAQSQCSPITRVAIRVTPAPGAGPVPTPRVTANGRRQFVPDGGPTWQFSFGAPSLDSLKIEISNLDLEPDGQPFVDDENGVCVAEWRYRQLWNVSIRSDRKIPIEEIDLQPDVHLTTDTVTTLTSFETFKVRVFPRGMKGRVPTPDDWYFTYQVEGAAMAGGSAPVTLDAGAVQKLICKEGNRCNLISKLITFGLPREIIITRGRGRR